ncbi:MAG: hypothetical protein B0W54_06445 [Cellvibrio sp. 79]|nr:MAG: hypothetical protein B0W54_06445 [Cellvibrio sp. 79]
MSYLQSTIHFTLNRTLKLGAALLAFFAITTSAYAQTIVKQELSGTTYIVKPDYRKCAFPVCGGWYLTPVNQYSLYLQTETEAHDIASLLPNTIYVAYINYKRLGLNEKQVAELEAAIRNDQALLRGNVTSTPVTTKLAPRTQTLVANGAWVGANKNAPTGPYLNITSTGIVCITTPCPYFKANIINSDYSSEFHDFSLEKAALDREQEAQAWQALSTNGLVITGTKYESTGFDETGAEPGKGIGIAATKVFFAFPAKK